MSETNGGGSLIPEALRKEIEEKMASGATSWSFSLKSPITIAGGAGGTSVSGTFGTSHTWTISPRMEYPPYGTMLKQRKGGHSAMSLGQGDQICLGCGGEVSDYDPRYWDIIDEEQ